MDGDLLGYRHDKVMAKTFFVPENKGYEKAEKMGKKVSSTVWC